MVAVVCAIGIFHPCCQAGSLVVEEDATVFHPWRRLILTAVAIYDMVLVLHRHVSPPVPRRHAHLAAELIDAVDRAALVRADDDEVAVDNVDEIALPLSAQFSDVDLMGFDDVADDFALAERAGDDASLARLIGCRGDKYGRCLAADTPDVSAEVAGREPYSGPVGCVHDDGGRLLSGLGDVEVRGLCQ